MDASLWSAGHGTHLKIVLVSLIASIAVIVVQTAISIEKRQLRKPRQLALSSSKQARRSITRKSINQIFAERANRQSGAEQ
jgi:hypothetical protein